MFGSSQRQSPNSLSILSYPYRQLLPLSGGRTGLKEAAREPGSAAVWRIGSAATSPELELVRSRPGGLALLVVLPPSSDIARRPDLAYTVQRLRPHGVLPYHQGPDPHELAHALRRPPADLPGEVTEYLSWRGLDVDPDTARLVRRIVELAETLRSVAALSRGLYMSRRALGRKFMASGLPVPSHWLHMARLLRVAIRLQNSDASVLSIAYEFGYPDGFSVSNQMYRLLGHRPTQVRERLGWEWLLEGWLRREAESGALTPTHQNRIHLDADRATDEPRDPPRRARTRGRSRHTA